MSELPQELQELIDKVPDKDTLLTHEIAVIIRMSGSSIRRLADDGEIDFIRTGSKERRYLRSSFISFLIRRYNETNR